MIIFDSLNFLFPKYFDYLRRKNRQNVLSRCLLRFLHFFNKKTGNKNFNKLPGLIGLYPIRYGFFFNFAAFFDKMFCRVFFICCVYTALKRKLEIIVFFIAEIVQFLRFSWNICHRVLQPKCIALCENCIRLLHQGIVTNLTYEL